MLSSKWAGVVLLESASKNGNGNINLNNWTLKLLILNMKPMLPALDLCNRAASLSNRIKIRTCKLPKDFFQVPRGNS